MLKPRGVPLTVGALCPVCTGWKPVPRGMAILTMLYKSELKVARSH